MHIPAHCDVPTHAPYLYGRQQELLEWRVARRGDTHPRAFGVVYRLLRVHQEVYPGRTGRKSSHGVRREAGYTPLRAAFSPVKHAPMQGHIWPRVACGDPLLFKAHGGD